MNEDIDRMTELYQLICIKRESVWKHMAALAVVPQPEIDNYHQYISEFDELHAAQRLSEARKAMK